MPRPGKAQLAFAHFRAARARVLPHCILHILESALLQDLVRRYATGQGRFAQDFLQVGRRQNRRTALVSFCHSLPERRAREFPILLVQSFGKLAHLLRFIAHHEVVRPHQKYRILARTALLHACQPLRIHHSRNWFSFVGKFRRPLFKESLQSRLPCLRHNKEFRILPLHRSHKHCFASKVFLELGEFLEKRFDLWPRRRHFAASPPFSQWLALPQFLPKYLQDLPRRLSIVRNRHIRYRRFRQHRQQAALLPPIRILHFRHHSLE